MREVNKLYAKSEKSVCVERLSQYVSIDLEYLGISQSQAVSVSECEGSLSGRGGCGLSLDKMSRRLHSNKHKPNRNKSTSLQRFWGWSVEESSPNIDICECLWCFFLKTSAAQLGFLSGPANLTKASTANVPGSVDRPAVASHPRVQGPATSWNGERFFDRHSQDQWSQSFNDSMILSHVFLTNTHANH